MPVTTGTTPSLGCGGPRTPPAARQLPCLTTRGSLVSVPLRRTLVAVVAITAVGAGGYVLANGTGRASTPDGTTWSTGAARTSATPAPVTTEPPPAEDVASDAPSSHVTGNDADVFLVYAEWDATESSVTAGGYVDGLVESDGTCTLTLTRGNESRDATAPAFPDATTTACGELTIRGADLASGRWGAVLDYVSGSAEGRSAVREIEIP
jgi:hypothetical protein